MKQVFRRVIDRRGRVVIVDLPEPHVGPGPGPGPEPLLAHQLGHRDEHALQDPGRAGQADAVRTPGCATSSSRRCSSAGLTQSARRIWHEMITPREIGYSGAGGRASPRRRRRGLPGRPDRRVRGHRARRARGTDDQPRRAGARRRRPARRPRSSPSAASRSRRCGAPTSSSARSSRSTGSGSSASSRRASRSPRAASSSVSTSTRKANELALGSGRVVRRRPARPGVEAAASSTSPASTAWTRPIVCASSDSSEIINSSMEITRRQGRVVHRRLREARHPPEALPLPRDRPPVLPRLRARQLPHRLREGPARLPVRVRALDREAEPRRARPADLDRRGRPRAADRRRVRPRRRAVRVRRGPAGHARRARRADPVPRRGAGAPADHCEINPRPAQETASSASR